MKKTFYNNKNLIIILLTALLAICAIGFIFILPKDNKEVKADTIDFSFFELDYGSSERDYPSFEFGITFPSMDELSNLYRDTYLFKREFYVQDSFFYVYLSNDSLLNNVLSNNIGGVLSDSCLNSIYGGKECSKSSIVDSSRIDSNIDIKHSWHFYTSRATAPSDSDYSESINNLPIIESLYGGKIIRIPLSDCSYLDFSKPIYCNFGFIYAMYYYSSYESDASEVHLAMINAFVSDMVTINLNTSGQLSNYIKDKTFGNINSSSFSLNENLLKSYNTVLEPYLPGYDSENVPEYKDVVLSHLELNQSDYANPKKITKTYTVPSFAWINKQAVLYYLRQQSASIDVVDYNVKFKSYYYDSLNDLFVLEENRIILQAESFDYYYGKLDVVYEDFDYKDFHIRFKDNNVGSSLFLDVYGTDVKTDENNSNYYVMSFDLVDIQEMLAQRVGWLFVCSEENFSITSQSDDIKYEFVYSDVTNEEGETSQVLSELKMTFPKSAEADLLYEDVKVLIEIIPDKNLEYSFNYLKVVSDDLSNLTFDKLTYKVGTLKYSEALKMNDVNFENRYNDFIIEAITLSDFDLVCAEYKSIQRKIDYENGTFVIDVIYEYHPLFKITNNYDTSTVYKETLNTFDYYGDYFVSYVPHGWRVKDITVDSTMLRASNLDTVEYDKWKYTSLFDFSSDEEVLIVPVYIEYTDYFPIRFIYMSQYNDTPFAVKKTFETEIKLIDYDIEHPKDLTLEQVANIVGVSTFEFLGVRVEQKSIRVTDFTQGMYVYDLSTMTKKSVKQVASNGYTLGMLDVPLCTYSSWTNQFGQDWNCLALNTEENTYFKYSDEVAPSDLYGFFTVAVFEEKVKNLNSWFAGSGSVGCFIGFKSREVKGSELYQFFDNMTDGILFGLAGYLGMAFCELFNSDNAVYYSYFFYIDGTSALNGIGNNKMDSYDDNSSSIDNTIEDVGDVISGAFSAVKDWFNNTTFGKVVKWVLIGLASVLVLGVVIKLIKWAVRK